MKGFVSLKSWIWGSGTAGGAGGMCGGGCPGAGAVLGDRLIDARCPCRGG